MIHSHLVGGGLGGGSRLDEIGELINLSHHPYRETTSPKCLLGHLPMMHSLDYFEIYLSCLHSCIIGGVTKRGSMVRVWNLRNRRGVTTGPISKGIVTVKRL